MANFFFSLNRPVINLKKKIFIEKEKKIFLMTLVSKRHVNLLMGPHLGRKKEAESILSFYFCGSVSGNRCAVAGLLQSNYYPIKLESCNTEIAPS